MRSQIAERKALFRRRALALLAAVSSTLSYGSPGFPAGEPALGGREWERRVMARLDLRLDEAQLGLEARFQWGPWLWIEAGSPPWSGGLKSFETSLGAQWALSPRAALSTFATWNFELSKSAVGAESYFDAEAFEARAKLQVFVGLPRGRFSLAIDRIVDSTPHTQARLGLLYARDFTTIASPTLYALTTSLAL